MKGSYLLFLLCLGTAVSPADDAAAPRAATRPRQSMPAAPSVDGADYGAAGARAGAGAADAPKFVAEAKWGLAGYNNNEVYYTIFVTSQNESVIRCTTEIKGFYFDNGQKLSIADRQMTTVFPNQPTQVGIWMDMDQASGATYSVKCRSI
jgi:hypothetical protein